jgi:hypothetical protein
MKWMKITRMIEYLYKSIANVKEKQQDEYKWYGMVMEMVEMQQLLMKIIPKPPKNLAVVKIGDLLLVPTLDSFRRFPSSSQWQISTCMISLMS